MWRLLALVARGCAAFVAALGRPEQDPRVAGRRAVEVRFSRDLRRRPGERPRLAFDPPRSSRRSAS